MAPAYAKNTYFTTYSERKIMKTLLKILTYISAIFSLLPFLKPQDRSKKTLLWVPKLLAGAFSPIHAIICGLGALLGLIRRDWKLASAGLIGVGLSAKFIEEVPASEAQYPDSRIKSATSLKRRVRRVLSETIRELCSTSAATAYLSKCFRPSFSHNVLTNRA